MHKLKKFFSSIISLNLIVSDFKVDKINVLPIFPVEFISSNVLCCRSVIVWLRFRKVFTSFHKIIVVFCCSRSRITLVTLSVVCSALSLILFTSCSLEEAVDLRSGYNLKTVLIVAVVSNTVSLICFEVFRRTVKKGVEKILNHLTVWKIKDCGY